MTIKYHYSASGGGGLLMEEIVKAGARNILPIVLIEKKTRSVVLLVSGVVPYPI